MAWCIWPQLNDLYYREGAEDFVYTGLGGVILSGNEPAEVTIPVSGGVVLGDTAEGTSYITAVGSFSLSGSVENTGDSPFTGAGSATLSGSAIRSGETSFTGSGVITLSGTTAIFYPFHYGFWPSYGWWNIGWWWSPKHSHRRKRA